MSAQRIKRIQVELKRLLTSPPPGITCRIHDSNQEIVIARIEGPENSPFYGACLEVEISPTESYDRKYPYTPPSAKFITEVYHPNIDSQGRICLSGLKSKPSGSWNCTMNMATILSAIRVLLGEPNLSDPLMTDIAAEYQDNYQLYFKKANENAMQTSVALPIAKTMEEDSVKVSSSSTCRNQDPDSTSRLNFDKEKITAMSPAPSENSFRDTSTAHKTTPRPETSEAVTMEISDDADSLSPILNASQRVMAPVPSVRDVKRGLFSQSSETGTSSKIPLPKPVLNSIANLKPVNGNIQEPEPPKQRAALRVDDFMFDSDEDDFFVPPKKQAKFSS